jgi:rSAM/selenodomain-associated transferase 2
MRISFIVPALDEADALAPTLEALQPARRQGHEIILVDGGSTDATLEIASPLVDRILSSRRGRALQMNTGAAVASGEVLTFVHADTRLPEDAETAIEAALRTARPWGRFDVRLSGEHRLLRVVERLMNLRSCLQGIATGDQAMFVRRDLFEALSGFPAQPLMEDLALSKALRRHARPACLHQTVVTSSRRWEENGVLRTIVLMWWLRARYALGTPAEHLARAYDR